MDNRLTSPFILLKRAWSLALDKSNVGAYLALGAIPQVFSFGIAALLSYAASGDASNLQTSITTFLTNTNSWWIEGIIVVGLISLLIISYVSMWYTALLYKIYEDTAAGTRHQLTSYIQPARHVAMRLLTTYVKVGLFTIFGFLLLVIPGFIMAVRYMFAPMAAALEDRDVKPLERSTQLVKGRFWKLVGRSALLVLCYNIPLSILQRIHPLIGSVWAITSPVFGLYFFLVYLDFKRTSTITA